MLDRGQQMQKKFQMNYFINIRKIHRKAKFAPMQMACPSGKMPRL